MKYKALAISFLLLLSVIAYMPLAIKANQPPPQTWRVELSVVPSLTNYTAPCKVSTIFPIDVYLWNYMNASGLHGGTGIGVYAFDFVFVYDNVSGISLVNVATHIPWDPLKYFVVANNSVVIDSTHLGWHFAVTAYGNATLDPSLELTAFYASLITFSFHVDDEPCWPNVWTTDFTINNVKISSDGDHPIPIDNPEIDNGTYIIYSTQPNIELSSTFSPANKTGKCVSNNFTVTVSLSNAEKVYGFEFYLAWNATYLESNIQCLTIGSPTGSLFPPPYETLVEHIDNTAGTAHVLVIRPCEKAPITAHEDITAATFCFHTIFVNADPMNPIIQYPFNSTISIVNATIYAKCPEPRTYTTVITPVIVPTALWIGNNGGFLTTANIYDDGTTLFITIADAVYPTYFGAALAGMTVGGKYTSYLYNNLLDPFGVGYSPAYYNGSFYHVPPAGVTGNFTVTPVVGGVTFKIPLANIAGYIQGADIALALYYYPTASYTTMSTTLTYTQQPLVKVGSPINFIWLPNIYDLNLDCSVDMGDLSALLKVYGKPSNWAALWPPNDVVDIFDFVVVAKHVVQDP